MLYGTYDVKTLINDEETVARLVLDQIVVKVVREDKGEWTFASVKALAPGDPTVNPTWKTNVSIEKLPDLTDATEARIFDAMADALDRAIAYLGLPGGG